MTNKPKAIGTACETAVVRYLRDHGFPHAERPAQHGALDQGDITGTPGVAWEVKAGKAAENASDAQVAAWLAEAQIERVNRGADVVALVMKRKGKGAASVGQWWALLPGWAYYHLAVHTQCNGGPADHYADVFAHFPAVRLTLADVVTLLRRAGYGDPIEVAA